jgi:hypothetical protein
MDLPVAPGEKYALIALDCATTIQGALDLGNGFFALPRGAVSLPSHWKEWIGSIGAHELEEAGLVLLAKVPSADPEVQDAATKIVQRRVGALFWGLLVAGHLRFEREGAQLSGGNTAGNIDVQQHVSTMYVRRVPGIWTAHVAEDHLRRAVAIATGWLALSARPEMRRIKLAFQTFMKAFGEVDLGQRIHQLIRAVCDGFTKEAGRNRFREKAKLFVTSETQADRCRELYVMRNNAEHFNTPPDRNLPSLTVRGSLERAHLRAHEAEALARFCISRFIETPDLWLYWDSDDTLDAFWLLPEADRRGLWGRPVDLDAAVASFDPSRVPNEE